MAAKIQITRVYNVALWSWDVEVDSCAICKNHVMEPCIECQGTYTQKDGDAEKDCVAAWGACNHAFHLHCITKWVKTRNVCPLDNQEWEFQKYGTSTKATAANAAK